MKKDMSVKALVFTILTIIFGCMTFTATLWANVKKPYLVVLVIITGVLYSLMMREYVKFLKKARR